MSEVVKGLYETYSINSSRQGNSHEELFNRTLHNLLSILSIEEKEDCKYHIQNDY